MNEVIIIMTVVVIAGGSQPEIVEFVRLAKNFYGNKLQFVVFDKEDNIDPDHFWTYYYFVNDQEVAQQAVSYISTGPGQILMKGLIQSHILLKALVQDKYDLKKQTLLSHIALIKLSQASNRSFLLTDGAMNIAPTTTTMIEIIDNVLTVAHSLGMVKPKIALISSAENFNPKMPSSVLAKEVSTHFQDQGNSLVFGPLSLDLALSPQAVQRKHYHGPIMGDADVIVVPNIDTGNVLYKTFALFTSAQVGGMIAGAKVPVILTSRSDTAQSKFYSLQLALRQLDK